MPVKPFSLPSYAKLNLFLHVTGRRPDGFHELVTLFERIDLHDDIAFSLAPVGEIIISCDDGRVPCDERNLVYKAAALLLKGENVAHGARIHITKRIPVAAGLAGGSSNAATAIMGLDRLWGLGLSSARRLTYARKIGSDVHSFCMTRRWRRVPAGVTGSSLWPCRRVYGMFLSCRVRRF